MEENTTYSREQKKQQLRKNIVDGKTLHQNNQGKQPEGNQWFKNNWKAIAIGMAFIAGIVLIIVFISSNSSYKTYKVSWVSEDQATDTTAYESFGTGVVCAGREEAVFYNESGEIVWQVPYEMKNPKIIVKEKYIVIFDQQGQKLVICSESGLEGSVETSFPVTKADISVQGVVAAVMEEGTSSYISYYDKAGTKLEIDIKAPLATYGYPYDISISPDGQQLMVSFYYISDGMGKTKVVFYDFDTGQEVPDRTIGAFEDYADTNTMIPQVKYFSDEYAVAIGDNRLSFFYTKNQKQVVEIIKDIKIDKQIQSAFYDNNYLGIITKDEEKLWLTIYDQKGEEKERREVNFEYENVFFAEDYLVFYNQKSCQIETFGGKIKFSGELEGSIQYLLPTGIERRYTLVTMEHIRQIVFK